jgi:hypothetical protein
VLRKDFGIKGKCFINRLLYRLIGGKAILIFQYFQVHRPFQGLLGGAGTKRGGLPSPGETGLGRRRRLGFMFVSFPKESYFDFLNPKR